MALRLAKGAGSKALVSKMEKLLATIEEDLAKEQAQLQLPKSAEFFEDIGGLDMWNRFPLTLLKSGVFGRVSL